MKFGDTLYQRSVPKWAAYNVNYNEIKRQIKIRTTDGVAAPVPIPGQGSKRWTDLENDLVHTLKQQYDNIGLFLRSKYGEIGRRLTHLEKQSRIARRSIQQSEARPNLQNQRYHKLLREAEGIGEDIQALSRFTSVQKTAFRKLLKKYRKWTNSTELDTRMEQEVFSTGLIDLDYAHQLERLSTQSKLITEELQGPMLHGESVSKQPDSQPSPPRTASTSGVAEITEAVKKGALSMDAALSTVPFGQSAGLATYWIHPDNVDEARTLLLRYMQEVDRSPLSSQHSSMVSIDSQLSQARSRHTPGDTYVVYYDNIQRFLQDSCAARPSRIALSARWCPTPEAVVTLSNMLPSGADVETFHVKRKDLSKALARSGDSAQGVDKYPTNVSEISRAQNYLLEHRDIKPLTEMHSYRSRYCGITNSAKVGSWATLDTDIVISPFEPARLGSVDLGADSGQAFPHAVLQLRWEFGHTPEVVRTFDLSHLSERVKDFSLESAAMHMIHKAPETPSWKTLLENDIRKVPITTRASKRREDYAQRGRESTTGTMSGTSSVDGHPDSVFSGQVGQSSATSEASLQASTQDLSSPTTSKPQSAAKGKSRKKRARIDASSPPRRIARYWNEFDDGDSDTNLNETYTIYVDPDEKLPGTELASKVFGAMYRSCSTAKARIVSWLPLEKKPHGRKRATERTRLLVPADVGDDSSDSDSTPTASSTDLPAQVRPASARTTSSSRRKTSYLYRPHQQLTSRQRALERIYLQSYIGLLLVSYVLLFISAILLAAGRRKAKIEVDAGVLAGIASAVVCASVSMVLIWMRKMPLSAVHWGIVSVGVSGVIVIGIGLLAAVIGRSVVL